MPECSIDGCTSKSLGYGWCSKHYQRWKRTGDPNNGGNQHPTGPRKNTDNYFTLHYRVRTARGAADYCIHRKVVNCRSNRFEWAHIHNCSYDDVYNYVAMCATCHRCYDSKLTFTDRQNIIQRYLAENITMKALGIEYGIHNTTVLNVIRDSRGSTKSLGGNSDTGI